jgi:hypothetical protein
MNRHLDKTLSTSSKENRPFLLNFLLVDFFVFILESALLFVLGVSITADGHFFEWYIALLIIDIAWSLVTWPITKSVVVQWLAVNLVAAFLSVAFIYCLPPLGVPLWVQQWLLGLTAVLRTLADYTFAWHFYFPQEESAQKLAIVLRGPPAIGKSTVAKLLMAKMLPKSSWQIDLDAGWGPWENKRYPASEGRYADLKSLADLLIIELGSGEPADESFLGATKNPREWVGALEKEGRKVYSFRLHADVETWRKRLLKKAGPDPGAETYYLLFDRKEWQEFPEKAGVSEEKIDTATIDEKGIADLIWQRIQTPAQ